MIRAVWAIMRQNRSKGLISARASEKSHKTVTFHLRYLPRSPPWTDFFYQTWNERSPCERNQLWQILWQSILGFKFDRKSIVPNFPVEIWRRRYNSAALPRSLWCRFSFDGVCSDHVGSDFIIHHHQGMSSRAVLVWFSTVDLLGQQSTAIHHSLQQQSRHTDCNLLPSIYVTHGNVFQMTYDCQR